MEKYTWQYEFGEDYNIPKWFIKLGFRDISWHNDAMPRFQHPTVPENYADKTETYEKFDSYSICIEHPNKDKREFECDRFTVYESMDDYLFSSENEEEFKQFITAYRAKDLN